MTVYVNNTSSRAGRSDESCAQLSSAVAHPRAEPQKMVSVTNTEGLPFVLAASIGVLICAAVIILVVRQRRHAILVASGPTYAVLQAVGGIVWMCSTVIFNGHIQGYSPREVALPTCFFWRCELPAPWSVMKLTLDCDTRRLDVQHTGIWFVVCVPFCQVRDSRQRVGQAKVAHCAELTASVLCTTKSEVRSTRSGRL